MWPGGGRTGPTSSAASIGRGSCLTTTSTAASTTPLENTRNRFLPVDGADVKTNLEKVYVYMLTGMIGGVQNQTIDDDIGPNETKRHLVSVDSSMREMTFIATWADPRVQVAGYVQTLGRYDDIG